MASPSKHVVNVNLGVLGHVDSGKTSLTRVLSTTGSTAAFDKHPQSKERGITIDLGFSSFTVPVSGDVLRRTNPAFQDDIDEIQFTLVDCPGHASLIRTIIGGAAIIDMMLLVVDVIKGMQTQTAECLVIGEITSDQMIVVLNKIDLIPEEKRTAHLEKMTKRILKTLETTKFSNAPIVAISAKPSSTIAEGDAEAIGIELLVQTILSTIKVPKRSADGPFCFAVDHCFSIRGQGTVLTGTVCQGSVRVNDVIEIPSLKVTKKVKSMQMFKKPVTEAIQGDRVGICVTQFDPKLLERGVAALPDYLRQAYALVAKVDKINYFKGSCRSKAKFHVSLMHETVMAKTSFFTRTDASTTAGGFPADLIPQEMEWAEELEADKGIGENYCLLEFEKPVTTSSGALLIASKLDSDTNANVCRLAFYGKVINSAIYYAKDYKAELSALKVYKYKSKEGVVERVVNEYEVIVKNMFKKEFDIKRIEGMKVTLKASGQVGRIVGSFGQSGKMKISFTDSISGDVTALKGSLVELRFKKFVFDKKVEQ